MLNSFILLWFLSFVSFALILFNQLLVLFLDSSFIIIFFYFQRVSPGSVCQVCPLRARERHTLCWTFLHSDPCLLVKGILLCPGLWPTWVSVFFSWGAVVEKGRDPFLTYTYNLDYLVYWMEESVKSIYIFKQLNVNVPGHTHTKRRAYRQALSNPSSWNLAYGWGWEWQVTALPHLLLVIFIYLIS